MAPVGGSLAALPVEAVLCRKEAEGERTALLSLFIWHWRHLPREQDAEAGAAVLSHVKAFGGRHPFLGTHGQVGYWLHMGEDCFWKVCVRTNFRDLPVLRGLCSLR